MRQEITHENSEGNESSFQVSVCAHFIITMKDNLLTPSFTAENGYRYYDNEAFEKLQEILLFRELEFPLKEIKKIVGNVAYDKEASLEGSDSTIGVEDETLGKVIKHAEISTAERRQLHEL